MTNETAATLHRINLAFYSRQAAEFSATRERPWAGWERLLEAIEGAAGGPPAGRVSVLDLGCGNGRLAKFLEKRWRRLFDYLGVDSSGALLEIARGRYAGAAGRAFHQHDLLFAGLPDRLPGAPFDLVAAFGLMHHVPGFDSRRRLLAAAAGQLAPGGFLAVSFWQFGAGDRFHARRVPWEEYNRTAAEPIDPADLEPGDTLLAWGEMPASGGPRPVRYCHWAPPAEAARLLAALPLTSLVSFSADGANGELNFYRILQRGRGAADAAPDLPAS